MSRSPIGTSLVVLWATNTRRTDGQLFTAASTVAFRLMTRPPLTPWLHVTTALHWAGKDRGWMGWGTSECSVSRECSVTSLKCSPSSSTRAYSDRVLNLERPSDGRGPKRNLPVVKPPQSYIHFPLFSNRPATNPIVYKLQTARQVKCCITWPNMAKCDNMSIVRFINSYFI